MVLYAGGIAPGFCYELDPTVNPKRIHIFLPGRAENEALEKSEWSQLTRGIYKIEGEQLTIRFGTDSDLQSFDSSQGNSGIVHLRRAQKRAPEKEPG